MANTNKLRIVETELKESFCKKHQCLMLPVNLRELKDTFWEMAPDLLAYDKNKRILYVGEITVSGYEGHRGRDFHVGAVRKLAESFSKFYLIKINENEIRKKIETQNSEYTFEKISCYFIVPEGSKFIRALGYRKKLFETGIMSLDEISISNTAFKTMREVLASARVEMKK